MQWWATGMIVYMLIGAFLSGKFKSPSSILDAIFIILLWALFWPLLLLLVIALRRIFPDKLPHNGNDVGHALKRPSPHER